MPSLKSVNGAINGVVVERRGLSGHDFGRVGKRELLAIPHRTRAILNIWMHIPPIRSQPLETQP